jgi:23S rRNA pseudouridine955/2504/2580 synthase
METPIVGDGKYGGADSYIDGLSKKMHLHARQLSVPHPSKGHVKITAPLPDHMRESWSFFEFNERDADGVFEDD